MLCVLTEIHRWVDVTIPPPFFSIYRNKLVIDQFRKHCPARRSLIVFSHMSCTFVNRQLKTRLVNGGVFFGHSLKCLVSLCGRRQNIENKHTYVGVCENNRHNLSGGDPMVVVRTAAFNARVRGSFPSLGGFKETNMFLLPSTRTTQYCGEPP